MKLFQMLDSIEIRNIDSELADCDFDTNLFITAIIAICAFLTFANLILIGYNSIQFATLLHTHFSFPAVPSLVACVCGYFVYNSISSLKSLRFKSKTIYDIFVKSATTFSCMGIFSIALSIVS